jgi:hypothetical protein
MSLGSRNPTSKFYEDCKGLRRVALGNAGKPRILALAARLTHMQMQADFCLLKMPQPGVHIRLSFLARISLLYHFETRTARVVQRPTRAMVCTSGDVD